MLCFFCLSEEGKRTCGEVQPHYKNAVMAREVLYLLCPACMYITPLNKIARNSEFVDPLYSPSQREKRFCDRGIIVDFAGNVFVKKTGEMLRSEVYILAQRSQSMNSPAIYLLFYFRSGVVL